VGDHLRNLNILKFMGPDETHPRVLGKMAAVVTRPLSIILKVHSRQVKSLVTGRRETLCPFLKKVGRRTLATIDLSASPLT